jgi:hypothetical protein
MGSGLPAFASIWIDLRDLLGLPDSGPWPGSDLPAFAWFA